MKFKFQSSDEESGTTTTHEFEALRWDEALDQFVKFLRGSGHQLHDTSVGVNEALHCFAGEDWRLTNITSFNSEKE